MLIQIILSVNLTVRLAKFLINLLLEFEEQCIGGGVATARTNEGWNLAQSWNHVYSSQKIDKCQYYKLYNPTYNIVASPNFLQLAIVNFLISLLDMVKAGKVMMLDCWGRMKLTLLMHDCLFIICKRIILYSYSS